MFIKVCVIVSVSVVGCDIFPIYPWAHINSELYSFQFKIQENFEFFKE